MVSKEQIISDANIRIQLRENSETTERVNHKSLWHACQIAWRSRFGHTRIKKNSLAAMIYPTWKIMFLKFYFECNSVIKYYVKLRGN